MPIFFTYLFQACKHVASIWRSRGASTGQIHITAGISTSRRGRAARNLLLQKITVWHVCLYDLSLYPLWRSLCCLLSTLMHRHSSRSVFNSFGGGVVLEEKETGRDRKRQEEMVQLYHHLGKRRALDTRSQLNTFELYLVVPARNGYFNIQIFSL